MLKSKIRNLTVTAITIVAAALIALSVTVASAATTAAANPGHPAGTANTVGLTASTAGAATPASDSVSPCTDLDSIRDYGQSGGKSGYYLTDERHNNPVETTGTGSCWAGLPDKINTKYFLIRDLPANLCLNVVHGVVYADSCQYGDSAEDWSLTPEDGGYVFYNPYYKLNLTAVSFSSSSQVVVAGGPPNNRNIWSITPVGG